MNASTNQYNDACLSTNLFLIRFANINQFFQCQFNGLINVCLICYNVNISNLSHAQVFSTGKNSNTVSTNVFWIHNANTNQLFQWQFNYDWAKWTKFLLAVIYRHKLKYSINRLIIIFKSMQSIEKFQTNLINYIYGIYIFCPV